MKYHDVIVELICFEQQIRWLHWSTNSYARHVAFGESYDKIGDLLDSLVENILATEPKSILDEGFNCKVFGINSTDIEELLNNIIRVVAIDLENLLMTGPDGEEVLGDDIDNIRETILEEIKHLKYKLTLE